MFLWARNTPSAVTQLHSFGCEWISYWGFRCPSARDMRVSIISEDWWGILCVSVRWGRRSPSRSTLGAQPCLVWLVSSFSPLKTPTVRSSFLNICRKYMKICSFKDRWEKKVFFHAGHFVLKSVGRISFSRKKVGTLTMVSPLFFNLFHILFLRTWYISQTTESARNSVVH